LVLAVLVAEGGFEDGGFFTGSEGLEGDGGDEDGDGPPGAYDEGEAGEGEFGEDVDGVADAGVDAVCDKGSGLGGEGESAAELVAGEGDQGEGREAEERAGDSHWWPGAGALVPGQGDEEGGREEPLEEVELHGGLRLAETGSLLVTQVCWTVALGLRMCVGAFPGPTCKHGPDAIGY
jgi:hypothetical protein